LTLKALGLGNGVIRPPYLMPPDEQVGRLRVALDGIGLWALEEQLAAQSRGAEGSR
jgi:hypothetical protein